MRPATLGFLDDEIRRVALTRALHAVPDEQLLILAVRLYAYAAAGLGVGPDLREDAEALRRTALFRSHVAPLLQPLDAAA